MYQEERLVCILDYLSRHEKASNGEIAALLQTSRDTVRRDFVKLVEQGAAIRTHGGIALPLLREKVKVYRERVNAESRQKREIAEAAARHISPGELIFLDVSTTIVLLCEQLSLPLTVYTHSLDNAAALAGKPDLDLYLLGGNFHQENRFFHAPETLALLESVLFDKVFLGAAALLEDGIYYANRDDARIKGLVARRAKQVFVLADTAKFSRTSPYRGLEYRDIDHVITDEPPPGSYRKLFQDYQIEVEISGASQKKKEDEKNDTSRI
ncbi:HTH-type transcriptional repressor GlcR [compost metagenome]